MKKKVLMTVLFFYTSFVCASAHANGFKILGVKSAKATAMGEAFIVQADNPSAIAFNPAGLTQLKGTQISVEDTITNLWTEHSGPFGDKEKMQDKWQVIPAAFITSDLGMENVAVGFGVTVPNGISSKWSEAGFARYVSTFSQLTLVDQNACFAYKLNEYTSLGAGVSYYYSKAVLESMVDYGSLLGQPGQMDAKSRLEGTGDAWGWNAGIITKLNERHSVAATYKSHAKVRYAGRNKIEHIPSVINATTGLEADLKTSIDFPATVVLGYAYKPVDKLKLEFNLDWTYWKPFESIIVDYTPPSMEDVDIRYDYHNTCAYKFGAEYLLTDSLALRGGYIYNESATPERNWRPSVPDSDMHFFSFGTGYKIGGFTFDSAVLLIYYKDITINNNVGNNETTTASSIDGKYKSLALEFSLGATYKF